MKTTWRSENFFSSSRVRLGDKKGQHFPLQQSRGPVPPLQHSLLLLCNIPRPIAPGVVHVPSLHLVESLELGNGDEDDDGLAATLDIDLAGSGELEGTELSLELGDARLEVEEGLPNEELDGVGGTGGVGRSEDLGRSSRHDLWGADGRGRGGGEGGGESRGRGGQVVSFRSFMRGRGAGEWVGRWRARACVRGVTYEVGRGTRGRVESVQEVKS